MIALSTSSSHLKTNQLSAQTDFCRMEIHRNRPTPSSRGGKFLPGRRRQMLVVASEEGMMLVVWLRRVRRPHLSRMEKIHPPSPAKIGVGIGKPAGRQTRAGATATPRWWCATTAVRRGVCLAIKTDLRCVISMCSWCRSDPPNGNVWFMSPLAEFQQPRPNQYFTLLSCLRKGTVGRFTGSFAEDLDTDLDTDLLGMGPRPSRTTGTTARHPCGPTRIQCRIYPAKARGTAGQLEVHQLSGE